MSEQQLKKTNLVAMAIVAVLVLAAVMLWAVNRQRGASPSQEVGEQQVAARAEEAEEHNYNEAVGVERTDSNPKTSPLTGEQRRELKLIPKADVAPGATLEQIIAARKTWDPVLQQWYGKDAPDFALTDMQGKQHRPSDYKGRNVLVVFWATYCQPCKMEIRHLILLEKRASPDYLKILAVTNENRQLVRKFAADYGINYTILFDEGTMPDFYRAVTFSGIPAAVYIDPQGKIKFITLGYVPLEDTKAILEAAH
jgi:peroxiredoxin